MQKQKVDQSGRPQVIQRVANKPGVDCSMEAAVRRGRDIRGSGSGMETVT